MAEYRLSAFADEADAMLDRQIDALARAGIGMAELRGVDGKSFMALTDGEAKAVRGKLDAAGVTLSALGSPIGKIRVTDPFSPHMDALSRAIELAHILGADKIRMFSFYLPEDNPPEAYKDEVFARMEAMLTRAELSGIRLFHENEKGIYGDNAPRCLELMTAFPGRLGCVFDPANFIQVGQDIEAAMDMLFPYVDYLHIKDALFADGSVVPSGMGDGRIPELIDRFSEKAAGMILTLEPHLQVFNGLSDLQTEAPRHKYTYPDAQTAFAAAADALKNVLSNAGFTQSKGGNGTWTR